MYRKEKNKLSDGPWSRGKSPAAPASFSCSWSKMGRCPGQEWYCLWHLLNIENEQVCQLMVWCKGPCLGRDMI